MATLMNCTLHGLTYEDECPRCMRDRKTYGVTVKLPEHNVKLPEGVVRSVLYYFMWDMERKLRKNDHKTGWRHLPIEALFKMLMLEIEEFKVAHEFLNKDEARKELVDVANFCMILWDRLSIEEEKNSGITK